MEVEEEKSSRGAMIVFKEQIKVRHLSNKEAREYANSKGVEGRGVRMLEALGLLALVEAYDNLYEKYQKCQKELDYVKEKMEEKNRTENV